MLDTQPITTLGEIPVGGRLFVVCNGIRPHTGCDFQVLLGVGSSLPLEVTLWCKTEAKSCPPDQL